MVDRRVNRPPPAGIAALAMANTHRRQDGSLAAVDLAPCFIFGRGDGHADLTVNDSDLSVFGLEDADHAAILLASFSCWHFEQRA